MRLIILMLLLLVSLGVVIAYQHEQVHELHHPRLAQKKFVAKVARTGPAVVDVYYASSLSTAKNDEGQVPIEWKPKFNYANGSCDIGDVTFPRLPLYASFDWQQIYSNYAYLTITCGAPYVSNGPTSIQCVNTNWIGKFGQCVCPSLAAQYWCVYTDIRNLYYNDRDCDGDGIVDHVCENIDLYGITRYVMATENRCQTKSYTSISECPVVFDDFPIAQVGQCFGLQYNNATTFQDCSIACRKDPSCGTWQWSNAMRQCWMGNPFRCGGSDLQWIGASRECLRPPPVYGDPNPGFCFGPGDQYYHVHCDNDGIPDHACVNGNTGGVIRTGNGCVNNWPNAINDDCHEAFD